MSRKLDVITLWLFTCCGMIFVMALLGAITRLTESGLSITDWKPVTGALPPMNAEEWNKAFAGYQSIPQYQIFNHGMSLEDFKHIYFWEWCHRLWGRLISLVFALPLFYFFLTKKITRSLFLKLCAIFTLGGLQGFIGWFMVQSGLETRTTVSPYRLTLHLGFALLLYALLLWTALNHKNRDTDISPVPANENCVLRIQGWLTLALLTTTILWGALTAGLRAGAAYNTWPLMEGDFLPAAAWSLHPHWLNLFENTALVQFLHRWLGPTTVVMILAWITHCWSIADTVQKKKLRTLGAMALIQMILGLATLLSHVEIAIAVTHQAGAITLLTLLVINLQALSGTKENK